MIILIFVVLFILVASKQIFPEDSSLLSLNESIEKRNESMKLLEEERNEKIAQYMIQLKEMVEDSDRRTESIEKDKTW